MLGNLLSGLRADIIEMGAGLNWKPLCEGVLSVSRAFRRGSPSTGAETRGNSVLARPSTMFERLGDRVLRVFGCPAVVYTSVTRINSAFPAITSVSNINSAIVSQYATDVEAEIDALISKRYVLPLTVSCPILTAIATRETIYRIAVQRALIQFPSAQQGKAPLQVQHEDDQKLLDKIAEGKIQLVSNAGVVVAADLTQMEIYSTTMSYMPTFHEGDWGNMVIDPDKLDSIAADRE